MRAALLLAAVSLSLTAWPVLADAAYTDHYGAWVFTGPGALAVVEGPAMESVLLRLADGTGFTAFIPLAPLDAWQSLGPVTGAVGLYRPPMLAFECYSDLGTGNLFIGREKTQLAGTCVQTLEDVGGELRYVVRFKGYEVPLEGFGVYCVRAAPQTC